MRPQQFRPFIIAGAVAMATAGLVTFNDSLTPSAIDLHASAVSVDQDTTDAPAVPASELKALQAFVRSGSRTERSLSTEWKALEPALTDGTSATERKTFLALYQ